MFRAERSLSSSLYIGVQRFSSIFYIIFHLIQVAAAGVAEDEDAEDEDDEQ